MSLNSGLFEHQEQSEQDLTEGPGWTIDQEKPTFWSGFGPTAAVRGLGQGAADGYAVLTGALHNNLEYRNPSNYATMTDAEREQSVDTQKMPEDWASEQSKNALAYAKTLTPDPRVTGTAANLLQGFSKAASLFTVGNLAGGPVAGAGVLAYSEGFARYHDLLDQGVDEETAHNAASLEGAASAAGALMPFSLPAKWLASMSGAGELLTQLGAGATLNTAFGAAQRYESAKILTDAGHPELADQAAVWDKTNLLTDALTGLFFGAHGALHDRKIEGQEAMRGVMRDAAKVVQDRQAVLDRAPGVPVNMESQAIHRASLETALTDLLQDKPVSLDPHDAENAVFARPAENGELPRDIIREEFLKSGVLDSAEEIDRWMRGEPEPEPKAEEPAANEPITPSVKTGETGGEVAPTGAKAKTWLDGLLEKAQRDHAMETQGQGILDGMAEAGETPKQVSDKFWSDTYYKLGAEGQERFQKYAKSLTGFEPGSTLGKWADGRTEIAKDWQHIGETISSDFSENVDHLQGTERGYVSMMKWANEQAAKMPGSAAEPKRGALGTRPDLKIVDEHGTERPASEALDQAKEEATQGSAEADKVFSAAAACGARFG